MTRDDARKLAWDYIEPIQRGAGCEIAIVDNETKEYKFGWVFFYQSKLFLETGKIGYALAGNAPIVVTRKDGKVHSTGTALPIERYLAEFESY